MKDITRVCDDIELVLNMTAPTAWVIRYTGNNKVMTLKSGKSLWKTAGHAKSALIGHFEYTYRPDIIQGFGFHSPKELAHYLLDNKILNIEQL